MTLLRMTPPRWSVVPSLSIRPNAIARSVSMNVFPSTTVSADAFYISTVGEYQWETVSGVWKLRNRLWRISHRSVSCACSAPT
jgi:hypothetical protein